MALHRRERCNPIGNYTGVERLSGCNESGGKGRSDAEQEGCYRSFSRDAVRGGLDRREIPCAWGLHAARVRRDVPAIFYARALGISGRARGAFPARGEIGEIARFLDSVSVRCVRARARAP